MSFRKTTNIAATIAVVLTISAVLAAAANASETSSVRFQLGTFAINHQTCKFLHPEVDPPLGHDWLAGRVYVAYEDGRHDAKDSCNTQRQARVIRCFARPFPPVDERVDHKGGWTDTRGVKAALGVMQDIQTCVLQAGGLAPAAP